MTAQQIRFNSDMPNLRRVLIIFLCSCIIISIFRALVVWDHQPVSAWVGHPIFETRSVTVPDWGKIGERLIDVRYRWDTGCYLKIAALGYSADDGSIIFPPLYPLLIAVLAPVVGGNFLLAALIISNISCFVALFLFFQLVKEELGSVSGAQKSLIYLFAFPCAFYLFCGYTDSLFIMFVLAVWTCALQKRWVIAGVIAGLAALTRLQGWLLVFPLTWMVLNDPRNDQMTEPVKAVKRFFRNLSKRSYWIDMRSNLKAGGWAVIFLSILALIGYMLWLRFQGMGDISTAYELIWNMKIAAPWVSVRNIFLGLAKGNLNLVDWINFAIFICVVSIALVTLFRDSMVNALYT